MSDHSKLGHRFLDAIETGNMDEISKCLSRDSITWHNTDEIEMSFDQQTEALKAFFAGVPKRKYVSRNVRPIESGLVMQLEFEGEMQDGRSIRFLPCIICTIENGLITRLDEYLDPTPFMPA